jgi:putative oxidoreductase
MYTDHTPVHAIGQIVIAVYFIWMGVKNIKLWDMNVARTAAEGLPAVPTLVFGFIIQFAGAFMVLADWNVKYGAILLIAFSILASCLFHRFWEMDDPMRRTYHFLLITNNGCIIGGLLLLI